MMILHSLYKRIWHRRLNLAVLILLTGLCACQGAGDEVVQPLEKTRITLGVQQTALAGKLTQVSQRKPSLSSQSVTATSTLTVNPSATQPVLGGMQRTDVINATLETLQSTQAAALEPVSDSIQQMDSLSEAKEVLATAPAVPATPVAPAAPTPSAVPATAVVNPRAAEIARLAYARQAKLMFGPQDGSLKHNPDNSTIEAFTPADSLANFALEVEFFNPYSVTAHPWDYGFIFRHAGRNDQYRLVIFSTRAWELTYNIKNPNGILVRKGIINNLDLKEGKSNRFLLICMGETGWLYVNDELISELNVSARSQTGRLAIGTGFMSGDEKAGQATQFHNLTVWSLEN